jgi:hypothetical protein
MTLNDAYPLPTGFQPIQQLPQQDSPGAIDAIKMRKVDIDRAASRKTGP